MYRDIFKCRVISPMCLCGYDNRPKGLRELRPLSLKSQMRFWWRSGKQATNIAALREEEDRLFGAAAERGGKAPFEIRMIGNPGQTNKHDFLPSPESDHKRPFPNSFSPNGVFTVHLASRSQRKLDFAVNVLSLSAILGGLGQRTRRGYGAFCPGDESIPDEKALCRLVFGRLSALFGDMYELDDLTAAIVPKVSPSSFLYPSILQIRVKETVKEHDDICKEIHTQSHRHGGARLVQRNGRHASPVCISIYEGKGEDERMKRYVVATLLNSQGQFTRAGAAAQNNFMAQVLGNV